MGKLEQESGTLQSQLQSQLQSSQFQNRPLLPNEIFAIINLFSSWQQYFRTFDKTAQFLTFNGLPQLATRLAQTQNDIRGALSIYTQMYQDALSHQTRMEGIWRGAATDQTRMILDATERSRQVFDSWLEKRRLVDSGYPYWVADLTTRR